jgi:hypothetical protein
VHPSPLKIAVKDHFGEALRYALALQRAGHEFVRGGPADLLLIDLDPPYYGHRELIDRYKDWGATVLLYPHGAGGPPLVYDGLYEPHPRLDGNIVHGPGAAEVLRRMGYPHPTYVGGWTYCDLLPFRPTTEIKRVLFGPTHPNGDGTMIDVYRNRNAEIFAELLEGPWQLQVRHVGSIEQNGLWEAPGVEFVTGKMDLGYGEIDAADVVVAGCGTFPTLAVARGVPTVVYSQGVPGSLGVAGESVVPLRNPDRYLDYMRYPYDAADGPLHDVMHAAAAAEATAWKHRFIGDPIDDATFAATVERAVRQGPVPAQVDATKEFTVAAFAAEIHERPELLRAFADRFGPEDDVSLVLWGAGYDANALIASVGHAAAAAGVDPDRLPDVLLLPLPGSPEADRELAGRADAVLSEWPAAGQLGTLPAYGVADVAELRHAADRATGALVS